MSASFKTIRIKTSTAKALQRIASLTGLTHEEIVNATITCVAAHVRDEKKLAMPFRILGEAETPVWIGPEGRERLAAATARDGRFSSEYLGGELLLYGLGMAEDGSLKRGPLTPASPSIPPPPADPPARPVPGLPKLKIPHAKKLLVIAELLNVRPQDLLDWTVSDSLKDWFQTPRSGLLDYAKNGLQYQSAEERERVLARVEAWQARRKVRALRRKTSMESGVAE